MKNESIHLKFPNYEIVKMTLIKVKNREERVEENNIGLMFKIVPNRNLNFDKVNIIQGVQVKASEEFPFDLEVVLKGNFELSNCSSDEEKIDFLIINASAILYPYLRATVTLLTSQLEFEKIVLPVMNFMNVIGDIPKTELILDQSFYENF